MSGGNRYKFQGTTIQVLTGFGSASPTGVISGITRANPAVVTETSHGRSSGDVIKITGVLGMTEVNGGTYIIEVVNANAFKLVDVDSSNYGAWTSGGDIADAILSNFCELTGYNRTGGTSPEIAATTICSTAAEKEVGLPDFGTTQIDFNFAPRTDVQEAIAAYYQGANAGETFAVKVTLPNSGGVMVQLGFLQSTSETAAVNGLWTGSMTILNTGKRYDVAA